MSERLDVPRLRALCEAATAGPWKPSLDLFEVDEGYEMVVETADPDGPLIRCGTDVLPRGEGGEAAAQRSQGARDAAFIAAARSALPIALDEVERLRGALTEIALYLSLRRSPDRDPLHAEEYCAAAERIANDALVPR